MLGSAIMYLQARIYRDIFQGDVEICSFFCQNIIEIGLIIVKISFSEGFYLDFSMEINNFPMVLDKRDISFMIPRDRIIPVYSQWP